MIGNLSLLISAVSGPQRCRHFDISRSVLEYCNRHERGFLRATGANLRLFPTFICPGRRDRSVFFFLPPSRLQFGGRSLVNALTGSREDESVSLQGSRDQERRRRSCFLRTFDPSLCRRTVSPSLTSRRRHHCRHCLKLVCSACSSNLWQLEPRKRRANGNPRAGYKRVCDTCFATLEATKEVGRPSLASRGLGREGATVRERANIGEKE